MSVCHSLWLWTSLDNALLTCLSKFCRCLSWTSTEILVTSIASDMIRWQSWLNSWPPLKEIERFQNVYWAMCPWFKIPRRRLSNVGSIPATSCLGLCGNYLKTVSGAVDESTVGKKKFSLYLFRSISFLFSHCILLLWSCLFHSCSRYKEIKTNLSDIFDNFMLRHPV
jgi:hypothetical protein